MKLLRLRTVDTALTLLSAFNRIHGFTIKDEDCVDAQSRRNLQEAKYQLHLANRRIQSVPSTARIGKTDRNKRRKVA
jgi:hypothetical protein